MSVTLRYDAKFHADETPSLSLDLASNPTLSHRCSYSGTSGTIDGTTTVAIDDVFSDRRSLSAGALTLDLTSLTSTLGVAKTFSGKKVKGLFMMANSANTAGIVVKDGATNPYLIFATSTGEVTIYPGQPFMQLYGSNLAAVSGTVKTIDFSSADTDAEFEIIIVVGT